jgi:putative transcription antitermination factor YqgF
MRYLGIDYGSKLIGTAISDENAGFAFPRDVVPNDKKRLETIARLVEKEKVDAIVVGDTRAYSGESNLITEESDTFARELQSYVKIPLHRVREAWSTQEAARFAPAGQKHNDSAAAAIILQRFLDVQAKSE